MAFGFVLLGIAYLDVLAADRPAARVRLLLAALFCVATKQEGSFFVLVLASALLLRSVRHRGRISVAAHLSLLAPLGLQLAVMQLTGTALHHRDMDFTLLRHWDRWWPRLLETLSYIARTKLVVAVVPLLALLVFFAATRRGTSEALLGPLLAQLGAYVVFMSLTAFSVEWVIEGSIQRLVSTLAPMLLLVVGARLGDPACVYTAPAIEEF